MSCRVVFWGRPSMCTVRSFLAWLKWNKVGRILPQKCWFSWENGGFVRNFAGFVGMISAKSFPTWWLERKVTLPVWLMFLESQIYSKRLTKMLKPPTTHLIIIIEILADQSLRHWNTANVGRSTGNHPICTVGLSQPIQWGIEYNSMFNIFTYKMIPRCPMWHVQAIESSRCRAPLHVRAASCATLASSSRVSTVSKIGIDCLKIGYPQAGLSPFSLLQLPFLAVYHV